MFKTRFLIILCAILTLVQPETYGNCPTCKYRSRVTRRKPVTRRPPIRQARVARQRGRVRTPQKRVAYKPKVARPVRRTPYYAKPARRTKPITPAKKYPKPAPRRVPARHIAAQHQRAKLQPRLPQRPATIGYTRHAKERMQQRGISQHEITQAIAKGVPRRGKQPGTLQYDYRGIRVIVSDQGSVITTYKI